MSRTLCPYCFEPASTDWIAFRCVNPSSDSCAPVEDPELGRYQSLREPPRMRKVIEVPRRRWGRRTSSVCSCGVETTRQVCLHCHNELPSQYDSGKTRIIALIGPKQVGKSHYATVLIQELMTRVGARFSAALVPLDDQTIRRYNATFRKPLYEEGETLPVTRSARATVESKYPLVYRWTAQKGRGRNNFVTCSLVFFDAAGEDLASVDLMSTEAKYIAHADGIIFLLDPLQIKDIRTKLTRFPVLPPFMIDPLDVLDRAVHLIRQVKKVPETQKVKTPIAFAFSKIDAIRELLDDGSPLHFPSNHNGVLNLKDQHQVHDSVRAYLHHWLGAGLDDYIQTAFAEYAYFGVSALGTGPGHDGSVPYGVAPFRVEDPFLWLLYKIKLIEAGKR